MPRVLSEAGLRWFGDREDPPPRPLPAGVLAGLKAASVLAGTCKSVVESQCAAESPVVLIRLGEVIVHPDSTFVKVVPGDHPVGALGAPIVRRAPCAR